MRWLGGRMTRAAGRWTRAAEVGWRLCDAVAHGLAVLPHLAEGWVGGETRVAEPSPRAAEVGLEAV
jgi:hypothetical protein